jgi:hypothetical protein
MNDNEAEIAWQEAGVNKEQRDDLLVAPIRCQLRRLPATSSGILRMPNLITAVNWTHVLACPATRDHRCVRWGQRP